MLHFESLGLLEAEKGIAGGIQAAKALGKAMAFCRRRDHFRRMDRHGRMTEPIAICAFIRKAYRRR